MENIIKVNKWTNEEVEILKSNYTNKSKEELMILLPHRSWSSILTKANKLSINKRNYWTPEEDDLLSSIYSNISFQEVLNIFPYRTRDGIIHRAQKLELNSLDHPIWKKKKKEYLVKNWESLPDEVIAMNINKTKFAVKRMRNLLGFHRQDKTQNTYENISKFIRGNIYEWKKKSMMECEYKCVITGDKNFEIHHLYPVNKIINDIYKKYNIPWKKFEEYMNDELQKILSLFIKEQDRYPLGVCVRKDIHQLFHHLYGQYNTTEEQWNQFKKDYEKGLYNYKISEVA